MQSAVLHAKCLVQYMRQASMLENSAAEIMCTELSRSISTRLKFASSHL